METKHLMRRTAIVVVGIAIVAVGLSYFNKRSELRRQEAALSSSIAQRQTSLASLQGQLSTQMAGLEEFEANVRGYMVEHKGAVAAMAAAGAGGSIALDKSNGFSTDAKGLAAVAGGIGLLYCVANASECAKVLSDLDKADAHRTVLESDIASTKAAITRESSLLANEQRGLEGVRRELGD